MLMDDLPGTARVAVLTGPSTIQIEERAILDGMPGDALVDVIASGVCGSDVHHFRADPSPAPIVLGHELVARVRSAPSRPELVGMRVAIDPHRTCGHCRYCVTDRYNLCESVQFLADPPTNGGFATRILVPAQRCHILPDTMTDEEGTLVEPAAVAVWAVHRGRLKAGETVLIVGAGPVGRLAARASLAEGAREVTLVDPNQERLRAETDLRIRRGTALTVMSPDRPFDVILECSGAPGTIKDATTLLARGGRIVAVGIGRSPLTEIDLLGIQSREAEILGSYRYRSIFDRVIELISTRRLRVDDLITHRFALEQVAEALSISSTDTTAVKTIVNVAPRGIEKR